MNGVSQYKMVGRTVTSTILEGLYQATEYTLDVRSLSGLDDLAEESEPVSQTALTSKYTAWLKFTHINFDSLCVTEMYGAKKISRNKVLILCNFCHLVLKLFPPMS